MSNTALTNKVALASTGNKLKHWTQAVRDLQAMFNKLKSEVVPEYHASPTDQYGLGDSFRYGHLRLLDQILYKFKQNADKTIEWIQSNIEEKEDQKYRWNAVTWHSGLFVAVGSHGRIITSRDGKKWSIVHWTIDPDPASLQAQPDFEFFDVQWCGSMFIAVGSYNSFTYSYDGTYWHVPMYVGGVYDNSNRYINDNGAPDKPGLTVCPNPGMNNGFKASDAWKGVAYDEKTGFIFLCGTQSRTMVCRHIVAGSGASPIIFAAPEFHVSNVAQCKTHVFNSIASMDLGNGTTSFVACGNWNEINQCTVRHTAVNLTDVQWNRENLSSLVVEDNVHMGGTVSETTGWNSISVRFDIHGNKYFVAIGTSGQAVISPTGIGDSWDVPPYEFESITTNFQCQAQGWNLVVAAGAWQNASRPNITMYNDSMYANPKDIEYGESSSSIPLVKHFLAKIDNASWYGAAFGDGVFVLAGSNNRLYYHEIEEDDVSGAALSVTFYNRYLEDLERRIEDLESQLLISNLAFTELRDGDSATFLWTDPPAKMFLTSGHVTLNFIPAPQYIYREMMIYLKADEETTLSLEGAGEWENDLFAPEWGRKGAQLVLKAIFIGYRIVIQIIDNDQLADNLMDDDLLTDEQQP